MNYIKISIFVLIAIFCTTVKLQPFDDTLLGIHWTTFLFISSRCYSLIIFAQVYLYIAISQFFSGNTEYTLDNPELFHKFLFNHPDTELFHTILKSELILLTSLIIIGTSCYLIYKKIKKYQENK